MTTPATSVRDVLRTQLTAAMRERDRETTAVCRSALAAIDNAAARPIEDLPAAGATEASALGAGTADLVRRQLTEEQVRAVVAEEIAERRRVATELDASAPGGGGALRREADVLAAILA